MKAAVCFEKDTLTIEDIRFDPPQAQEVLVRMVACGVCHMDLSVLNGTVKMKLPCVLGHEGAGIVEEVGAGVTHVKKGDKVVLSFEQAYLCTRKAGTCVVVGVGSVKEQISLNVFVLPLMEKRLLGSWFGTADVHRDMPKLLDLYTQKKLKLDELVTKTYKLDQLDAAFADMQSGVNARGVVLF